MVLYDDCLLTARDKPDASVVETLLVQVFLGEYTLDLDRFVRGNLHRFLLFDNVFQI